MLRAAGSAAALIVAALCATSAQAQDQVAPSASAPAPTATVPADVTIADLAVDLAYSRCPPFLSGEMTLKGNESLAALGFRGEPARTQHPRFGQIETQERRIGNGEIGFGGVAQLLCQVNMIGPDSEAALARVRAGLSALPYAFAPDATNSGSRDNGANVETLKARIDDQTILYVQFIKATVQGKPMSSFQIFGMDQ